MKTRIEFKWIVFIILFLAACQKDEEVLTGTLCKECEAFTGVYELVLVVTPACRYTPENQVWTEGQLVIDGRVEVTEYGQFKQELLFWNGEGRKPDTANTTKCAKTYQFEVVNDSTIKVNYDQCGKMYYNYVYFTGIGFRHEYGYLCNRYYQKIN